MIYEKRVASMASLRKELSVLDGDAGVRVVGRYGGKKCFAFVTRFGGRYTVLVYQAEGNGGRTPGRRLESRELERVEEVVAFLKEISVPGVEAYVY